MKTWIPTVLFSCLPFVAAQAADETQPHVATSQQVVQAFSGQLKAALQEAIKAGGPIQAIDVCNKNAPAIAASVGAEHGVQVRRTSLKVRSPDNRPDVWETEILQQFEQRLSKGEPIGTLTHAQIVEQNGQRTFRFMQAIGMPPMSDMPCLKCHGEALDPAVASQIKAFYPSDQATGYRVGDLRGAFSISQSLD